MDSDGLFLFCFFTSIPIHPEGDIFVVLQVKNMHLLIFYKDFL